MNTILDFHFACVDTQDKRIELELEEYPLEAVAISGNPRVLSDKWRTPGFYCLIYPGRTRHQIYVGQARSLKQRAISHFDQHKSWLKCVLFKQTLRDFDPSARRYLEYKLYHILALYNRVNLKNNNEPSQPVGIEERQKRRWNKIVEIVPGVLMLLGYDLGDCRNCKEPSPRPGPRPYKLKGLIEEGFLSPPIQLISDPDTKPPVQAVINPDATVTYKGKEYRSLSGAGQGATGVEINGWLFWGCDQDGEFKTMHQIREELTGRKHFGVSISDLIATEYLDVGETLSSTEDEAPAEATVLENGELLTDKLSFGTPSAAAGYWWEKTGGGFSRNGWTFWSVRRGGKQVMLADLRKFYIQEKRDESV